jgi:hypothetical protein
MRRWVLIILLLVYPFQVALAVADKCCVATPAGMTHHATVQGAGASVAEPVYVVDDDALDLQDVHCAACSFGHSFYLPTDPLVLPAAPHQAQDIASRFFLLTSPPAARFERPKWTAAA